MSQLSGNQGLNDEFDAEQQQTIREGLEYAYTKIVENYAKYHYHATGSTDYYTYITDVTPKGGSLTLPAWAQNLEYGRGPGGRPPIDAIMQWARAKGIPANGETLGHEYKYFERFCNIVAWQIATSGSKLFQEGAKRDVYSKQLFYLRDFLKETLGNKYSQILSRRVLYKQRIGD